MEYRFVCSATQCHGTQKNASRVSLRTKARTEPTKMTVHAMEFQVITDTSTNMAVFRMLLSAF